MSREPLGEDNLRLPLLTRNVEDSLSLLRILAVTFPNFFSMCLEPLAANFPLFNLNFSLNEWSNCFGELLKNRLSLRLAFDVRTIDLFFH